MTPTRCPRCNSPAPHLHPAVQHEGEVEPCRDAWHTPALICPRTSPGTAAPCCLSDTAEAHDRGHEFRRADAPAQVSVSWATDGQDRARWQAADNPTTAVVHPATGATGVVNRHVSATTGPIRAFGGSIAYGSQPGALATSSRDAQELARLGMNVAVYFGEDADMVAAVLAEAERRRTAWNMTPLQSMQSVWDDVVKHRIMP